ncbi:MAG: hypothetical protein DI609_00670 [Corynebacterium urealyticum]|uniref:PPE domain-containing protein n=1 Tax=Corynebacterium urealyticum TaxID=43771 RepID=A0A2W5D9C2_9CORY|nr:MAG: hypothetical protein DI609_00670 [Corynebacterium urealyticum]
MPMEPWFVFPPEVNARRLAGHSGGALQAGAKYQSLAAKLSTDVVGFLTNMKDIAVATPGHVADAIAHSGTKQAKYIEGQAANAAATGAQLTGVGNAAMVARASLIPEPVIAQNRAVFREAAKNAWWSAPAAAVATAAGATYAMMWTINALAGTGFDTAATLGSQPIPMLSPIPSLPGGVRGVPSTPKALMPSKMITNSPAVSAALQDSQAAARQLITPADGLRAGGLGSGRGMPQVAGNPGEFAARGGVPQLGAYNPQGMAGSTHTTRSSLASLPSYSPSGSGMSGGMPVGATGLGTGARSGIGSLSFNHSGSGSGSMRIGGGGVRAARAAGTGSGLGSGAGSSSGAGAGAGAGAGSPTAAVRGGALGGSAGMHAEKALGGRMGPAYSGVSATDKSLTTVGNQTRAGTAGGMGPGMAGARRGGHATEEHATQASYIAKDVSFESLEEKRAHDKKQRELFR